MAIPIPYPYGLQVIIIFVMVLVGIALYIFFALAIKKIAEKTNTENSWLAFIPIANYYLLIKSAGLSGWFTFLLLLSFIPLFGSIAVGIFTIYVWWKIAEAVGKPGWWSLLMIIPIVNLVIIGILAWGK